MLSSADWWKDTEKQPWTEGEQHMLPPPFSTFSKAPSDLLPIGGLCFATRASLVSNTESLLAWQAPAGLELCSGAEMWGG